MQNCCLFPGTSGRNAEVSSNTFISLWTVWFCLCPCLAGSPFDCINSPGIIFSFIEKQESGTPYYSDSGKAGHHPITLTRLLEAVNYIFGAEGEKKEQKHSWGRHSVDLHRPSGKREKGWAHPFPYFPGYNLHLRAGFINVVPTWATSKRPSYLCYSTLTKLEKITFFHWKKETLQRQLRAVASREHLILIRNYTAV